MNIEGSLCHLSEAEQWATDCPAEVVIGRIDAGALLEDSEQRLQLLELVKAEDDDDLTVDRRAALVPAIAREMDKMRIRWAIAGQITAYECEEFVNSRSI